MYLECGEKVETTFIINYFINTECGGSCGDKYQKGWCRKRCNPYTEDEMECNTCNKPFCKCCKPKECKLLFKINLASISRQAHTDTLTHIHTDTQTDRLRVLFKRLI